MGDDRPRGEAAIGRGPVAALGLGRRTVTLQPALPPDQALDRLERRTSRVRWLDLFGFAGSEPGVTMFRRPERFVLLRHAPYRWSVRPVVGRFAEHGSLRLTVGPPRPVVAVMVLLLGAMIEMFVTAPFRIADGDWFRGVLDVFWASVVGWALVASRHDAERLLEFVTETLDAR